MRTPPLFDRLAALAGVLVLLPLFAAIALWIKQDSVGPVFFRQERVGQGGRLFRIWKFRTMVADAPQRGGPLTVGGDARITKAGTVLRRYKLDELPQLLNVIAGEMALVGPRPEVPKYVALYTPDQRRVLEQRPGITDPASLAHVDESETLARQADPERHYIEILMPGKLRINLDYAARRTWASDIGVILRTLARLVS